MHLLTQLTTGPWPCPLTVLLRSHQQGDVLPHHTPLEEATDRELVFGSLVKPGQGKEGAVSGNHGIKAAIFSSLSVLHNIVQQAGIVQR